MNPKLSIVTHFYNSPEKIERQVAAWKKIDAAVLRLIEFIVVDDGSAEVPTIDCTGLPLRMFCIKTDIPWNQGGARNLGAFHASGEWGLFFDVDQLLLVDTLPSLLFSLAGLNADVMYFLRANGVFDSNVSMPMVHHPNTYLVNVSRYRVYGMMDEDFSGYYGFEDLYMQRVWESSGRRRLLLDGSVFFDDVGFKTPALNRDLERNKALAHQKLAEGCKNSPGILRFEWEEVLLA